MPEEKADSSGFKVVDRRSFTSEGQRVPDKPQTQDERESSGRSEAESYSSAASEPEISDSEDSARFTTLVSYLSTTAMFQLGLLPGPSGETIPPDLLNGRRTIDLLEVLQEKTRGNLTGDEAKLLDDILYELRMSFIEVQKHQARRAK